MLLWLQLRIQQKSHVSYPMSQIAYHNIEAIHRTQTVCTMRKHTESLCFTRYTPEIGYNAWGAYVRKASALNSVTGVCNGVSDCCCKCVSKLCCKCVLDSGVAKVFQIGIVRCSHFEKHLKPKSKKCLKLKPEKHLKIKSKKHLKLKSEKHLILKSEKCLKLKSENYLKLKSEDQIWKAFETKI